MERSGPEPLYVALLGLRAANTGSEASPSPITPSDQQIQDILRHTPSSLVALSSYPSLANLAQLEIGKSIVWLVNQFSSPTSSSGLNQNPSQAPKSLIPVAFGPRKRGTGGKLALEKDDAAPAPPPSVPPAPTDPTAPLDLKSSQIYEKYQREMKSVRLIATPEEAVSDIQRLLLEVFAAGYPVQLSRLDIPSPKAVYSAIPTILSLRQPQTGTSLQLGIEDVVSPSLTQAIKNLYPDVTDLQVKLALCEWYHDLHPELQLNSAKYVQPKIRSKRKDPSGTVSVAKNSTAPVSSPIPAVLRKNTSTTTNNLTVPTTRSHFSHSRTAQQAGNLLPVANYLDDDCDEIEVDQDPSPDYREGNDADEWRNGTRPRKLPKRTTTSLKFIPFSSNTSKERAALADDDFSGTEEAYFADVYHPSPKAPKTTTPAFGTLNPAPTANPASPSFRKLPESIHQTNGAGTNVGLTSSPMPPSTTHSAEKPNSVVNGSDKEKSSFHFRELTPQATLELFNQDKFDVLTQFVQNTGLHSFIESRNVGTDTIDSTWSSIVIVLCSFLLVTKERTEAQRDPVKKLVPIVSLLRTAVEQADAKGPSLHSSVPILCTTLTTILNQHVQQLWLQSACSNIFNLILSVPAYWTSIKPAPYSNLVKLYTSILQHYPTSDLAPSNARIFRLLFSQRAPSSVESFSPSVEILQVQSRALQVVNDVFLPLREFLQRTTTKALQEVTVALSQFLLHSGASYAQPILGPVMQHLNHLFLAKLAKSNLHSFIPEIVNLFRIQLALLVSPDGAFDSGLDRGAYSEAKPTILPEAGATKPENDEDPSKIWLHFSERSSLVGESHLYDTCIRIIGFQNHGIDTGKHTNHADIDSNSLALFQLVSSLIVKRHATMSTNSVPSNGFKKSKGADDPKRLIRSSLFGVDSIGLVSPSTPLYASSSQAPSSSSGSTDYLRPLSNWDSTSTSVLSWLQFTFVFVTRNPLFFHTSWTLNTTLDLLSLLEKAASAVLIEFWTFRLLAALATATHLQKHHPSGDDDDEDEYGESIILEERSRHASHSDQQTRRNNTWTRVWTATLQKLGHTIEPTVGEASLVLLDTILLFDLVPRQSVLSTQSQLWRLPLISEHHSWDVLPLLRTMASKYPLVGTGTADTNLPSFLLDWVDGALTKSYNNSLSHPDTTVANPSMIASLLSGLITGHCTPVPVVDEKPTRGILSPLHDELELALSQVTQSRLLDQSMNPFKFNADLPANPSPSAANMNLFPLNDSAKEAIYTKLSHILASKFGQTKAESPVQMKNNELALDPRILSKVARKQSYHGCLLIEILKSLPNASSSLKLEAESQLREIFALLESNLKLTESDPSVASIILHELSKVALCSEHYQPVHMHFGPVLDIAARFLQSPAPASQHTNHGSSQSLGHVVSSEDDIEDILDYENFDPPSLTRQTTELILSRNPSTALPTPVFYSALPTRSQCALHASWLVASVFKVLEPDNRNMSIAESCAFESALALLQDPYVHYSLLCQLLDVLSERVSTISKDRQVLLVKIISELLPTVCSLNASAELTLVKNAALRILRSFRSTSTTSLTASSHLPQQQETFIGPPLAAAIVSLKKVTWCARVALQPVITELLRVDDINEVGGPTNYEGLQARIIQCLTDADVRVRAAASSSIRDLLGFFSDHETIVADLMENSFNKLLAIPTNLESVATCLSGLASIAQTSSAVLDEVLLAFHRACISHPIYTSYVPRLLDARAATWGYKSRQDTLSFRLPYIISQWNNLSQFPAFLYKIPDTSAFCAQYYPLITTGLLTPRFDPSSNSLLPVPIDTLEELARFSSRSISEMTKACSNFIYAATLLLDATQSPEPIARSRELHSMLVGDRPKTRQAIIPSVTSSEYVFHLIQLVADSHGPSVLKSRASIRSLWKDLCMDETTIPREAPVNYNSTPAFRRAIRLAAQKAVSPDATFAELVASDHGRPLVHVIKSLDEWFFKSQCSIERSKSVLGLILLASSIFLDCHSANSLFYSCFRYLRSESQLQLQSSLLWTIESIWQAISSSETRNLLLSSKSFVDDLLSAFHPLLLTDSTAMQDEAARVLKAIFFIQAAPLSVLAAYGRFPSYLHPIFEELNKLLATTDSTRTSTWSFLNTITGLDTTAHPTRILPSLESFCSEWIIHRKDLLPLLIAASKDESSTTAPIVSQVSEAVWSLLRLSKSTDESVQRKVAEALGMIGLFDPDVPILKKQLEIGPTPTFPPSEVIMIDDEETPTPTITSNSTSNLDWKRPRECVSADGDSILISILQLLSEKERSPSQEISAVAKGVLNRLVSALPLPPYDESRLPLLCWKDVKGERASYYRVLEDKSYQLSEWWTNLTGDYDQWLKKLCASLSAASTQQLLRECSPMCMIDPLFAEEMLPLLIHDIFQRKDETWLHFEQFLESATESPSLVHSHRKHFSQLISAIVAIRSASIQSTLDRLAENSAAKNSALAPDFAFARASTSWHLAQISRMVSMPCTSLLFFEHWCESQHGGALQWPSDSWASRSNSLAMRIFGDLGDPESVHALRQFEGAQRDATSMASLLMQERNWPGVLNLFETAARPNAPSVDPTLQRNMLLALQYAGYHNTMQHYVQGLQTTEDLSEFQFQAAWRISDWNASWASTYVPNETPEAFPFHRHAFLCLRAVLQGEHDRALTLINHARIQLLRTDLAFISSENAKQLVPIMAQLQFFTDIQYAINRMKSMPTTRKPTVAPSRTTLFKNTPKAATTDNNDNDTMELLQQWEKSLELIRYNAGERFELAEPLIALRGLLLPSIIEPSQIHEVRSSYWVSILHAARKSKSFQLAAVALEHAASSLEVLESLPSSTFPRITSSPASSGSQRASSPVILSVEKTRSAVVPLLRQFGLEECYFYWAKSLPNEAVVLAKAQIKELEKSGSSSDLAKMLRLAGEWLGESKLETPSVILESYFERSANMLREIRMGNAGRCRAYFDLGKFADQQYRLALDRKTTPEWQESMELQSKIQSEQGVIMDDKTRSTHASLFRVELSATRREQYEERLISLLRTAVSSYIYALLKGDQHNTQAVFRLTSLWFSNPSEPKLAELIKPNITKISAYKFLPLTYQIVSRISPQKSSFQDSLQALVCKIVTEHPHPCLYQLISLANAGDSNLSHKTPITLEKARVAKTLIGKVAKHIPETTDGMLSLSKGYMELAMHPFPKNVGSTSKIPTRSLIQFRGTNIPVITSSPSLPNQPDAPVIIGFDTSCRFVGGIHRPRLIVCRGSDGRSYQQLVKGTDDLRQDAVMEQLFRTINAILNSDQDAAKMKLRVRTYNVIPLSPISGVLEWVSNTQPVGEYLMSGPDAAHVRYRPQDWLSSKCRSTMEAAHKFSDEKKFQVYKDVTKHFKPVLRHFFNENFVDPATWYDRRLAYTRSLASSCMVGHMVGLGDRHSQNILLDRLSGEIIHIDLGIAFEQGKALPIPELVPFRLTRDLVDALGVIGVKGVFTRCCEHTVRVLREKHANLVTIAEVFLHDPLSKWLMRMASRQQAPTMSTADSGAANAETAALEASTSNVWTDEEPRNTKATTTLLKFRQKLLGQEEDSTLSVTGQVQHLLTVAQDEKKLACMFVGWAAWL